MAGDVAIEIEGLRKSYKDVEALCGIDLQVEAGTILGLLGPNGAGKTTAVRILATCCRPRAEARGSSGSTSSHDAPKLREQHRPRRPVRGGRREPHRLREPRHGRAPLPPGQGQSRERANELLERFDLGRGRRSPREDLLRRYAPAPRPRRGACRPSAGALPRRADHRARPAKSHRPVGGDRGAGRGRHHRASDHAVSGRGRPARGPDRRHRPRLAHRPGQLGRAEGQGRRRTPRGQARGPGERRGRPGDPRGAQQ